MQSPVINLHPSSGRQGIDVASWQRMTRASKESDAAPTTRVAKKRKASTRRYGKLAAELVERAVHEMKRGKLASGRSKKKVKSRRQAVAIGLSQARKAGGKVPPDSD